MAGRNSLLLGGPVNGAYAHPESSLRQVSLIFLVNSRKKASDFNMKKVLLFSSGFVSGIMTTFLLAILINADTDDSLHGLTIFPEKSECIKTKGEVKVFQVLKPTMALASTGDPYEGIVVLLINYDEKYYYDEQKIKISPDKCARQIGTYQYTTKNNTDKTVPVVVVEKYDQNKRD